MDCKNVKGCAGAALLVGMLLGGCVSGYSLKSIEGGRVAMTAEYDTSSDSVAAAILRPYKETVDSIMSPVIGHAAKTLDAFRPESPLSNLLADIIRQEGRAIAGKAADVGVMNMGGIRNSLPEGEITFGMVYEITPFENALCVLTFDGKTLLELFGQIARLGGEGLSGASLVISPEGELLDAKVGGKPIAESREYTVATIDYLAEGNDKMSAFRKAKSKAFPPRTLLLRTVFLDYVKECERTGRTVDAQTDGRVRIEARR